MQSVPLLEPAILTGWQEEKVFTAAVADHVQNPRNCGEMADATHYGQCGIPGEGPYVQIWLKIESGRILKATYNTNGCPAQIASGSMTAQILAGRTVEQALLLEARDIELMLGGLPEGKGHCPQMAVDALRSAIGVTAEEWAAERI